MPILDVVMRSVWWARLRRWPCARCWLAAVLLLGSACAGLAQDVTKDVLTTARSIRLLTPAQASEHRPVLLRGVITHANPHIGDFFIHDGQSPIYIHPQGDRSLTMGDEVEVRGFTSAGNFAPCAHATAVRKLGTAPLPDPLPYNLNRDDSRWLDAHWVQTWAILAHVETWNGYTLAVLRSPNGVASLLIPGEQHVASFRKLLQASVRVRGVCVPSFNERRIVNQPPRIFAQRPDSVVVLERAEVRQTAAPVRLLEHLYQFSPDPHPGAQWVKVSGVVTRAWPGKDLYIQDDSAAARVRCEGQTSLAPGTQVEVDGTLVVRGATLYVEQATVRALGSGPAPTPRRLPGEEAVAGKHPNALVTLAGRIVDVNQGSIPSIAVQAGAATVEVLLPTDGGAPELQRESRVEVAGILQPPSDGGRSGRLLVRDWADLTIVELPPPPPWWTAERLLLAASGATLLALAVFVWVVTLRRRIRRQTAQLRLSFEKEAQLEVQLRQAQKLEAIGRLAGGVAHDFNNLLTVIIGCSDLLKMTLPRGEPAAELVDAIGKAGTRAADLTNQLLLFSRRRSVELLPLSLNDVIADAEKLLRRVLGEHIELVVQLAPELPCILADPGLLHQVLLNLAANARDAMPQQGRLILATGVAGAGAVRLTVGDTGCGMDAETQARLFEPFYTTKEVGKGTGLGLASVYGIVQTLQGEIRVRSAVGQGTTWEIDFPPARVDSAPAPPAAALDFDEEVLKDAVVLLVEDDAAVRAMTQLALAGKVAALLTASRPSEALQLAEQHKGPIHLLLTDIVMPEMNGRVLAEKLHRRFPQMLILCMSGYTSDEILRQGVQADELVLLQKPFTRDTLLAKLCEMLAAQRHSLVKNSGATRTAPFQQGA